MSLQEKMFLHTTIDPTMGQLPLLSEDLVVLQDGLLNLVGCDQDLLAILLGLGLNAPNLGAVSPPLNFHIIHLWEKRISE